MTACLCDLKAIRTYFFKHIKTNKDRLMRSNFQLYTYILLSSYLAYLQFFLYLNSYVSPADFFSFYYLIFSLLPLFVQWSSIIQLLDLKLHKLGPIYNRTKRLENYANQISVKKLWAIRHFLFGLIDSRGSNKIKIPNSLKQLDQLFCLLFGGRSFCKSAIFFFKKTGERKT